jgi:flagellar biosynthetic protein FliQ
MTPDTVLSIGKEALMVTLIVSAPMLIAGLIVGLAVSIFQAVTQIHEMTLTFIPKIIAVILALLVFMSFMLTVLMDFTIRLFQNINYYIG